MKIWIRSQDREILCECTSFTIDMNYSNGIEEGFSIDGATTDGTVLDLGIYSSKEQAIKVLDQIQEHIKSPTYMYEDRSEYTCYNCDVFQMPQDAEVEV